MGIKNFLILWIVLGVFSMYKGHMLFTWNKEKNKILKRERGIGFEDIIEVMDNNLLDVYDYPKQKIYVLKVWDYVYFVPFVKNADEIFLKTIIPSRKAKKIYGV